MITSFRVNKHQLCGFPFNKMVNRITCYQKTHIVAYNSQSVKQLILIACLFVVLPVCNAQSQYKLTNNHAIIVSEKNDTIPTDEALKVAENFFASIEEKNRTEWNKFLSQQCFQEDGRPREKVNRFWEKSSLQAYHYNFSREIPAVKTNQKTYIYAANQPNKKKIEKTLVLVLEHGKWKVFSMK